jgi:DNA gyrase subunit A
MATNIPPHNLGELMSACTAMVSARKLNTTVSDKQLFSLVPAPDFPTGAAILGTDGARQLFSTSNGGIVLRATTQIENVVTGRKGQTRTAIIVTELPYQVNKASLLEKIATMVNEKKLEGIADLRDESDRDGIRVVIELKRDAIVNVVLNNLYKKTPLQTTFSGNFLALMASKTEGSNSQSLVPQRFTLRQALDCFLDFRFDTLR